MTVGVAVALRGAVLEVRIMKTLAPAVTVACVHQIWPDCAYRAPIHVWMDHCIISKRGSGKHTRPLLHAVFHPSGEAREI